jgi:tripartite-type tricarboxylate transporter receptor subunit TctC
VARVLSQEMGKPVVVENQGGASGTVALNSMARAAPDGYTMLLAASGTVVIHPLLVGKYAAVSESLAPVSLVSTSPHVLVVTNKINVRTVPELIAYARAHPGKLNFGSAGTGGAAHLGMELFISQAGIEAVHVPYKGTSQVLTDLVSGEVQALFSSMPSLQSLIDKGSIRAIGMTGPSAAAQAAGIPEISKTGLPGFGYTTWYAMFVPKGTPDAVIQKLNVSLGKVLNDQALQQKLTPQGLDLQSSSPAQLGALMSAEAESWKKIIQAANIKPE